MLDFLTYDSIPQAEHPDQSHSRLAPTEYLPDSNLHYVESNTKYVDVSRF